MPTKDEVRTNTRRVDSPYENWPGYVLVPLDLTPEQFDDWWNRTKKIDAEDKNSRPAEYQMFEERYPLIIEWHITHVDGTAMDWPTIVGDAKRLPALKLASFVTAATQDCLIEARSLPNLQKPLKTGTKNEQGTKG